MRDDDTLATEVLESVRRQGPLRSRTVTIVVTSGSDAGKRLEIDDLAHRQVLIGTSAACEVRLSDRTVSRRHLVIELEDSGVAIRDLGSSNLTFVNGAIVREGVLSAQDTVLIGQTELRIEVGTTSQPVSGAEEPHFGGFFGAAPVVRRMFVRLERLAPLELPVLLEGEPGTGKELLAEALHDRSPRREGPFVPFDCANEIGRASERILMGDESNAGLLDQARGGTLYIDEIAALPPPLQVKLARAIETGSYRIPGTTKLAPLDLRIIAATRRDLNHEVQEGRCREELVDLLATARVPVPALRRRPSDIPLLTRLFWLRFGGEPTSLPQSLIEEFQQRSWLANTRELAAATAAFLAKRAEGELAGDGNQGESADEGEADEDGATDYLGRVIFQELPFLEARAIVTLAFERRYLKHMLAAAGGNISKAASASGISRRYFYKLRAGR